MKKIIISFIVLLSFIFASFLVVGEVKEKQAFQKIFVEMNPYGISPLTWLLKIDIKKEGRFDIKILAKNDEWIDINYSVDIKKEDRSIPIYWLYSNFNNTVLVSFTNLKGRTEFTKTFPILTQPYDWPKLDLDILENEIWTEYQWLYGFMDNLVLFDQNGEIRWYLQNDDYSMLFTHLENWNFMVWSQLDKLIYHKKHFYEVSLLWEELKKYTVPKLYHHEIIELENWNILTTSSSELFFARSDNSYREDTIVEIDRITWNIVKSLDFKDLLSEIRPTELQSYSIDTPWRIGEKIESSTWDWIHINSLFETNKGDIIASLRNTDMIVSVDMDKSILNWILTHNINYDSLGQYRLNVDGDQDKFLYPLAQHSAVLDKEGSLLVFDNGVWRSKYTQSENSIWNYSRVLKYSILLDSKTAMLDWQYTHSDSIYTPARWSVMPTDDGLLVWFTYNSKSVPKIIELDDAWKVILDIEELSGSEYYRAVKYDILKVFNK